MSRAIVACVVTAILVGVGTAGAAGLLTSGQIKDGTIRNHDIHKKTISLNRLTPGVQRLIAQHNAQNLQAPAGTTGATGPKGDTGAKGDTGPKGDRGVAGAPGLDSDQPRVVDANNLRGFTLAPNGDNGDTTANGTVGFATPPVAPPLGSQALKFTSDTGKTVAAYAFADTGATSPSAVNPADPAIAELTHASYASLIHTPAPVAVNDVALKMEVYGADVGTASGYTTVNYEPYQNGSSDTVDQWHRHSFDRGLVWSSRNLTSGHCTQANPCPFSTFALENPNAVVITVKFVIGQNSGDGWSGFEGYVDDFSYGFGPVVRYDLGG
jgi:hypothetical protein